jgi:hypothetical protein
VFDDGAAVRTDDESVMPARHDSPGFLSRGEEADEPPVSTGFNAWQDYIIVMSSNNVAPLDGLRFRAQRTVATWFCLVSQDRLRRQLVARSLEIFEISLGTGPLSHRDHLPGMGPSKCRHS